MSLQVSASLNQSTGTVMKPPSPFYVMPALMEWDFGIWTSTSLTTPLHHVMNTQTLCSTFLKPSVFTQPYLMPTGELH